MKYIMKGGSYTGKRVFSSIEQARRVSQRVPGSWIQYDKAACAALQRRRARACTTLHAPCSALFHNGDVVPRDADADVVSVGERVVAVVLRSKGRTVGRGQT